MRINQFLAKATGLGRRSIDKAIENRRIKINGSYARLGQTVGQNDQVFLDSHRVDLPLASITLLLDKPVGYVCSRNGQGSATIYDLIPEEFHKLKPVGRLDKDSSGLILLTNDGYLANSLSHPGFKKTKIYEVELNKTLTALDRQRIIEGRVVLDSKPSQFDINQLPKKNQLIIKLAEGRNRQIRRTFALLGYSVVNLNRIQVGPYKISDLDGQKYRQVVTQA